jgi:hypothetical protein
MKNLSPEDPTVVLIRRLSPTLAYVIGLPSRRARFRHPLLIFLFLILIAFLIHLLQK